MEEFLEEKVLFDDIGALAGEDVCRQAQVFLDYSRVEMEKSARTTDKEKVGFDLAEKQRTEGGVVFCQTGKFGFEVECGKKRNFIEKK